VDIPANLKGEKNEELLLFLLWKTGRFVQPKLRTVPV
jgi:hypothetical protein